MALARHEVLDIRTDQDVVLVRRQVRQWAQKLSFSLTEQTRVVTAASELARNTLVHGGGGTVRVEAVNNGHREGLRLTFEDQGPGIPDVALAMTDGYTTGGGMGLGLGGARRLSSEFEVVSQPGGGTRVTMCRWK